MGLQLSKLFIYKSLAFDRLVFCHHQGNNAAPPGQGGQAGSPPSPFGTAHDYSGCRRVERCSLLLTLPEQPVSLFAVLPEGKGDEGGALGPPPWPSCAASLQTLPLLRAACPPTRQGPVTCR